MDIKISHQRHEDYIHVIPLQVHIFPALYQIHFSFLDHISSELRRNYLSQQAEKLRMMDKLRNRLLLLIVSLLDWLF